MKKILIAILCLALSLCMIFAMAGCGAKDGDETTTASVESTEATDTTVGDGIENMPGYDPNWDAGFEDEETENTKPEGQATIAEAMTEAFKAAASEGKDINAIAEAVAAVDELKDVALTTADWPIEGNYFDGFSQDVTGYTKAVTIRPMIGSIPLVAYVIETEDAQAFIQANEPNLNTRWLICVAADEALMTEAGGYVFAVLAPYTF